MELQNEEKLDGLQHRLDSELMVGMKSAVSLAMEKEYQRLMEQKEGRDIQHVFLTGMAFLYGYGMEQNISHGEELVQIAAEAGLPEAMEALGMLYDSGELTDRDYRKAAGWWDKLTNYWEDKFGEEYGEEEGVKVVRASRRAGEDWLQVDEYFDAKMSYYSMNTAALILYLVHSGERHHKELEESNINMGNMCKVEGKEEDAKIWYRSAQNLREDYDGQ
ncbi:MAG: hypothetical protein LUE87_08345 [Lachnospiraceae bacterium]|nr:hypothetical protein [Lachnospiraceae bacterium]